MLFRSPKGGGFNLKSRRINDTSFFIMKCLTQLKQHLCPGTAYRRAELAQWSKRVDQHIKVLIEEGVLTQLESDLYYCPKKSLFGMVPISATERVKQFLKDGDFLLTSPNAYNQLGVGTTQLYNITVVYNHKYQGTVDLDGRHFEFRRKNKFPKKLSNEFLLVDLMNNLKTLAEDHEAIREKVEIGRAHV